MTDHQIGPDQGFERWLAEAAPTLNDPPATPKAEMWENIGSRLSADGHRPARKPRRAQRPWLWPLALAAALLLGIGIDRFALRPETRARAIGAVATTDTAPTGEQASDVAATDQKPRPRPGLERAAPRVADATPDVANATPGTESRQPSSTLRLAASQTLAQAELLLAAYRTDDAADAQRLGRWAQDVLGSTRLLLDSRAASDPQLRALLQDLELVLVQIAQLSGAPLGATDRELLDRTLRDGDLLPRLRSAVPAGPTLVTGSSSDD